MSLIISFIQSIFPENRKEENLDKYFFSSREKVYFYRLITYIIFLIFFKIFSEIFLYFLRQKNTDQEKQQNIYFSWLFRNINYITLFFFLVNYFLKGLIILIFIVLLLIISQKEKKEDNSWEKEQALLITQIMNLENEKKRKDMEMNFLAERIKSMEKEIGSFNKKGEKKASKKELEKIKSLIEKTKEEEENYRKSQMEILDKIFINFKNDLSKQELFLSALKNETEKQQHIISSFGFSLLDSSNKIDETNKFLQNNLNNLTIKTDEDLKKIRKEFNDFVVLLNEDINIKFKTINDKINELNIQINTLKNNFEENYGIIHKLEEEIKILEKEKTNIKDETTKLLEKIFLIETETNKLIETNNNSMENLLFKNYKFIDKKMVFFDIFSFDTANFEMKILNKNNEWILIDEHLLTNYGSNSQSISTTNGNIFMHSLNEDIFDKVHILIDEKNVIFAYGQIKEDGKKIVYFQDNQPVKMLIPNGSDSLAFNLTTKLIKDDSILCNNNQQVLIK